MPKTSKYLFSSYEIKRPLMLKWDRILCLLAFIWYCQNAKSVFIWYFRVGRIFLSYFKFSGSGFLWNSVKHGVMMGVGRQHLCYTFQTHRTIKCSRLGNHLPHPTPPTFFLSPIGKINYQKNRKRFRNSASGSLKKDIYFLIFVSLIQTLTLLFRFLWWAEVPENDKITNDGTVYYEWSKL